MIKLESTHKYFFNTEEEAEEFVEQAKTEPGQLIDWKISIKETKKDFYVIVTTKHRHSTLEEAKS